MLLIAMADTLSCKGGGIVKCIDVCFHGHALIRNRWSGSDCRI